MERPRNFAERLDACEISGADYAASMLAASVGMIWDIATGHVATYERLISSLSEDDRHDSSGNRLG